MSVGLQRLRDDADTVRRGALVKGEDPALVDRALELDANRRRLLTEVEALKAARNSQSAEIGQLVKAGADPKLDANVLALRQQSTAIGAQIDDLDPTIAGLEA